MKKNKSHNLKIAVDFDGTIVEHEYPAIGRELLFAFQTLKELQKRVCILILWRYSSGKELDEAVEYCRKNGVEFYAVNRNYPEETIEDINSRKIDADIYIDDRNIGGFPGWSEIWQMFNHDNLDFSNMPQNMEEDNSLLGRIKSLFK